MSKICPEWEQKNKKQKNIFFFVFWKPRKNKNGPAFFKMKNDFEKRKGIFIVCFGVLFFIHVILKIKTSFWGRFLSSWVFRETCSALQHTYKTDLFLFLFFGLPLRANFERFSKPKIIFYFCFWWPLRAIFEKQKPKMFSFLMFLVFVFLLPLRSALHVKFGRTKNPPNKPSFQ